MQEYPEVHLRKEALEIEKELIEIRRHIHENPETAYQEVETAKYIVDKLKKNTQNLEIIENIGVTGIIAMLKGKAGEGKTILLRADMDALNLIENSGEPFSSKIHGKHHACGHDGHVAMLLGAAIIIDKWVDKIKGTIKFCFQPAEEGGAGAKKMIDDDKKVVLENPIVEKCFAIHMNNSKYYPYVGVPDGPATSNSDKITIEIIGKGGHAMAPDHATDSVQIGCNLVSAFYQIISRNIDPRNMATISIGKIEAGTAGNIIAEKCNIVGTVRSQSESDRQLIKQKMENICKGFEISYSCQINFDYKISYSAVQNDKVITSELRKSANKIVQTQFQEKSMAGEDFSFFSQKVPGCFFTLGSAPEGTIKDNGNIILCNHHSPKFTFDEKVLPLGVSIWMQLVEDQMIL